MGKIFYLMGKSATGKDTMFQHLEENPELVRSAKVRAKAWSTISSMRKRWNAS